MSVPVVFCLMDCRRSSSSIAACTLGWLPVGNDMTAEHPGQVKRSPRSSPPMVKGIWVLHTGQAMVCGMSFSMVSLFLCGRDSPVIQIKQGLRAFGQREGLHLDADTQMRLMVMVSFPFPLAVSVMG